MNFFDMNSEICNLRAEEERILASFTRRLIEVAATGARAYEASPASALNVMRLPAIAVDGQGLVIEVNSAAEAMFDSDVKVKDQRLYLRDLEARALLKEALDGLSTAARLYSLRTEPIIAQRQDKLPVILRVWPYRSEVSTSGRDARAVLTLNALGPKPGPPPAILAKTFGLTPSEAKLACIIARGAPPHIAAKELNISRETARNQLKSIFAKTDTHRQSELVALLLQVE